MTFGNYVLFNLLVAILVEGFQESKEEEKRQLVCRFVHNFWIELVFKEEAARKRVEEEERERRKELEEIIAKTTSKSFMKSQEGIQGVSYCFY